MRIAEGGVLFRPRDAELLRPIEPAEGPLRALEAKSQEGRLTLDDLAAYTATLDPRAARRFDGIAATFDTRTVAEAAPALRIWSALTATERATLRAGGRVEPRDALAGPVRSAFLDGVFEGGWLSEPLRALFDAPLPPDLGARLSLFGAPSVSMQSSMGGGSVETASQEALMFTVGTGSGEGILYALVLPDRPVTRTTRKRTGTGGVALPLPAGSGGAPGRNPPPRNRPPRNLLPL